MHAFKWTQAQWWWRRWCHGLHSGALYIIHTYNTNWLLLMQLLLHSVCSVACILCVRWIFNLTFNYRCKVQSRMCKASTATFKLCNFAIALQFVHFCCLLVWFCAKRKPTFCVDIRRKTRWLRARIKVANVNKCTQYIKRLSLWCCAITEVMQTNKPNSVWHYENTFIVSFFSFALAFVHTETQSIL